MKNTTLITLILASLSHAIPVPAHAGECERRAASVGAEYEIHTHHGNDGEDAQSRLRFWRLGQTVVHEYPIAGIADVWFRTADGRLKTTRYFDEARRAIEYQPGDLNRGRGLRNWSVKNQLVSESMIEALRTQGKKPAQQPSARPVAGAEPSTDRTAGFGASDGAPAPCRRIEWLSGEVNGQMLQIAWLPELRIPFSLSASVAGETRLEWTLTRLVDQGNDEIVMRQQERGRFKEIDFGDIGDDETDPFFARLIHMGFVQHGHGGFYDSQGHAADGDAHGSSARVEHGGPQRH
ncbi:MAG: hypothetical protein R3E83_07595 [Burkholderiaceae bacterium]